MKVPWKYRKVSAEEFSKVHERYQREASYEKNGASYYCASFGAGFYREGANIVRGVVGFLGGSKPRHWTRGKNCDRLVAGKDIVDCLCGVCNGRGRLSWLVGQHYVGMCPFKNKWKRKLKLKAWVGKNGRSN